MLNLQEYFLKSNEFGEAISNSFKKEYLVYGYSKEESRWGFQPVFGHEEYLYICEMPINEVTYLMTGTLTIQVLQIFHNQLHMYHQAN